MAPVSLPSHIQSPDLYGPVPAGFSPELWASAEEGIDQVGCDYTAQGFEFDYVGVIVGPDLVYRLRSMAEQ